MTSLAVLVIIVVVVALLFDFINGWNDAANAIATIVGTRVLSPLAAVGLAAVFNLGGAMVGVEVANTMANMIDVDPVTIADKEAVMVIIIAGLLAAATWAATMTVFGMPISGSHSLIGGIIGAAVAAGGVEILVATNVVKTLAAMLIAPVLGFFVAYFFYVGIIWLTRSLRPSTMNQTFGKVQILSASWMAFTHGTNDAQKVMGIITMALLYGGFQEQASPDDFEVQLWVKLACGAVISIGTAVGGWKVIKTLGYHLTKLGPTEGFAAETSASLVLSFAAWFGIPTSTTHTITGSILGIGATRGLSSVRWGLGEKIVLAWVFTLPSTAAFGGALYWLLSIMMGIHL
jgi:PiT family inorganic phosphate transporter